MLLIKNEDEYTVFVNYTFNSGWCTINSVEVLAKNTEDIDCTKIAEKIFKKYKKDMELFYKDLEEHGLEGKFIKH
jgi:hypothetical protein